MTMSVVDLKLLAGVKYCIRSLN